MNIKMTLAFQQLSKGGLLMLRFDKMLSIFISICIALTSCIPAFAIDESSSASSSSSQESSESSSVVSDNTSSESSSSTESSEVSESSVSEASSSETFSPSQTEESSKSEMSVESSYYQDFKGPQINDWEYDSFIFSPTDPVPDFIWTEDMELAVNNGCLYLKTNQKSSGYLLATGISGVPADVASSIRILDEIEQKHGEYAIPAELAQDIIALTFGSFNPSNFRGINLIQILAESPILEGKGVYQQSISLIAFDSGDFSVSQNSNNSREELILRILDFQNQDGGFSETEKKSSSSISATAIAITALSSYSYQPRVSDALQKALLYLQNQPLPNDCVTLSQLIIAISSLSLLPTDTRFIDGTDDLITELLKYQSLDGGFALKKESQEISNAAATEQAIVALTAAKRQTNPFLFSSEVSYKQSDDSITPTNMIAFIGGGILTIGAAGIILYIWLKKQRQNKIEKK